jgi:hypothetical protein
MPDMELRDVVEEVKYFEKPQNDDYYNDAIQYSLDLTLHRNEAVHEP